MPEVRRFGRGMPGGRAEHQGRGDRRAGDERDGQDDQPGRELLTDPSAPPLPRVLRRGLRGRVGASEGAGGAVRVGRIVGARHLAHSNGERTGSEADWTTQMLISFSIRSR